MFNKDIAKTVIDNCLSTGADFAEIFYEDTYTNSIQMISSKIENVSSKHIYGVGIRILLNLEEVYGYTSDVTLEGMLRLSNKLISSYNEKNKNIKYEFKEEDATLNGYVKIDEVSSNINPSDKVKYLKIVDDTIKSYDKRIVQRIVGINDKTQYVTIANSNGKYIKDIRNQQRISAQIVAKDDDKTQSQSSTIGGNFGLSTYENKDLVSFAKELCKGCLNMLNAPNMVGGVYPVVIHNGFGGVLFHEACGHSLEATSVAKGLSVFTNKLGCKIASDIVTAIDDGTLYNEWGSTNCDDEGNITKRNVLIKDGILQGYMIDDRNNRRMKMNSTGSSRRESYRFSPTSRMTNTFIANGTSSFDDIIKNTKYGLFAKSMGGGSVNPVTGEFNFAVNEGYMIEDGKITHPVRGATLIGNGANALLNIDMISNNQTFGHGVCGSKSGSVPANVGQPTIRILNMTVGGQGGKE